MWTELILLTLGGVLLISIVLIGLIAAFAPLFSPWLG